MGYIHRYANSYNIGYGKHSQLNHFDFNGTSCIDTINDLFSTGLFRYGVIKVSHNLWRNVLSTDELKSQQPDVSSFDSYFSTSDYVSRLSEVISGASCSLQPQYVEKVQKVTGGSVPLLGNFRPVAVWGLTADRVHQKCQKWPSRPNAPGAAIFLAKSDKPVIYNLSELVDAADNDAALSNELPGLLGELAPLYFYQLEGPLPGMVADVTTSSAATDAQQIRKKFKSYSPAQYDYTTEQVPLRIAGLSVERNSQHELELVDVLNAYPFTTPIKKYSGFSYGGNYAEFTIGKDRASQSNSQVLIACREMLPAATYLRRKPKSGYLHGSLRLVKTDIIRFLQRISGGLSVCVESTSLSGLPHELKKILKDYETYNGTFSYRREDAYKQLVQKFESTFEKSFKHWSAGNCDSRLSILQWLLYERESLAYRQALRDKPVTQKVKPVNHSDAFKHYTDRPAVSNIEDYLHSYLAAYKKRHDKTQSKKTRQASKAEADKVCSQNDNPDNCGRGCASADSQINTAGC